MVYSFCFVIYFVNKIEGRNDKDLKTIKQKNIYKIRHDIL